MKLAKIKKSLGLFVLIAGLCTGCSSAANGGEITVISREDGSGTRGAFIELFGIEQKDADGNKVDYTIDTAEITNSTSVMITSVSGNKSAIGYVSLGSINDTVKALNIDGVAANVDNVKNGTYKISRPFNIAYKEGLSDLGKDFVSFILSDAGQKVVEDDKYIPDYTGAAYQTAGLSGKLTVGGSSSVTPVMEKLKEAYIALNPNVQIEVQQSDSTTGMTSVNDGICEIGMASRPLKDSELENGLIPVVIATDGIAVIANKESSTKNISTEQVKQIYMGEITKWSEITE